MQQINVHISTYYNCITWKTAYLSDITCGHNLAYMAYFPVGSSYDLNPLPLLLVKWHNHPRYGVGLNGLLRLTSEFSLWNEDHGFPRPKKYRKCNSTDVWKCGAFKVTISLVQLRSICGGPGNCNFRVAQVLAVSLRLNGRLRSSEYD